MEQITLSTCYRNKKSKRIYKTMFWVGKKSVAMQDIDVRRHHLGKVVTCNVLARNYVDAWEEEDKREPR
jgi:hypothetical protein